MTKYILFLSLILPLVDYAQSNEIRWSNNLTWDQIKQKAKAENKYIFVDCFTTWCGPCRLMEKNVYCNDSVASLFNNTFLSVKLQLDKTSKDNDQITAWYAVADKISKQYKVIAYPTFLFFSPSGSLVQKETGYKSPEHFIEIARSALIPGKIFKDPYALYDSLVSKYKAGSVDYSHMAFMIETAELLQNKELAKSMLKDFYGYLSQANDAHLYTKENISFLANHINSKSIFFNLFYQEPLKINRIMQRSSYAQDVVDNIIQRELVIPTTKVAPGMMRSGPTDNKEFSWDSLYNLIKAHYNDYYAKRNTIKAKINWYFFYNNYHCFSETYLTFLRKYGLDTADKSGFLYVNFYAWRIFFQHINNKSELKQILKWMTIVVDYKADQTYFDTYASLLYKVGRREEAITWEKKALKIATSLQFQPDVDEFKERLDKMENNKQTWDIAQKN